MLMPMEAIFAQMLASLSNDRIRPTIFSHSRWPYQDPYIMCISSFGKHTHASLSEGGFFPMPIDMFTMPLTFSVLQAAYKVCLGKIFAEALARVALALPCASCRSMGNPASWTMGSSYQPSMVWPFCVSAANRCVHTHQLYFLSPNCLELPENFLLSKWIKMTTLVSLPHLLGIYKTTRLVQFVKISTMVVHCYFLLAHLMILHPMLTGKNIIFELIKTTDCAEWRKAWGQDRDLKWSFKDDR